MRARRWPTCAFACGLWICVAGCSAQSGLRAPVRYERTEWNFGSRPGGEYRSLHYTLRTTCKQDVFVDSIPSFLESCWAAYEKLLPRSDPMPDPAMTYLFQSRWEWEHFTMQFAPERASTYRRIRSGGYSERGVTVSHYSGRSSTLSILAHEGLHQYLENTRGRNIPPWINEGLACYFESFDLDSDGRPIFTPERNALRRAHLSEALMADRLIPLAEILATHAGEQVHKRSADVRGYYAQEWALVLYLRESPLRNPYHRGFRDLLRELGSETMLRKAEAFMAADSDGRMTQGEAVFRAYITDDLETFQRRFTEYARGLLGLKVQTS